MTTEAGSAIPTRKVSAGAGAGALSIVVVWLFGLAEIDVPPEVASAFTTLLSLTAAWIMPEKPSAPGA